MTPPTAALRFIDNPALVSAWHPVAECDDIGSRPHPVRLLGRDLVLWRDEEGAIVGAPDRCPHRQAPLSAGSVEAGIITCPYHGWSFAGDGRCVAVPSSGSDAATPPAAHLRCVGVAQAYGLVWVNLGTSEGRIPRIPQEDDPAFRRINSGMERWAVCALRMVDNFMDISHFPWVHTGTFGAGQEPRVPRIELTDLDEDFFGYAYEVDANNPDEAIVTSGSDEPVVHRHMTTGFSLPLTVRSTIRYEDGLEHILLLCSTPVDELTSLFTFVVWRNDDHRTDPEATIAFDRAIGAEDKAMLEQVPGVMPLDRTALVSVQADKPSVEWRRRLVESMELADDPSAMV